MQLSASSAALDLALSQSPGPESLSNGWGAFNRHRSTQSQQSVQMSLSQLNGQGGNSASGAQTTPTESPISVRPSFRHSLDLKFFDNASQDSSAQVTSPTKHVQATPPKLQTSYSANDVATMKSNGNGVAGVNVNTSANTHAQQHFHNHNASMGRIPPSALNNRLSREVVSPESPNTLRENANGGYQSIQSALQASAPPFGPAITQAMSQGQAAPAVAAPNGQQGYPTPGYYNNNNNYNVQMMTMGMQNMQLNSPIYSPHNPYANYNGGYPPQAGARDSQARVIQQRRMHDGEGKFLVI